MDLRVAAYLFVGKQDLLLTTRMSSTLHWQKPSLLRSNICRVGLQLALVFELLTAFRPTFESRVRVVDRRQGGLSIFSCIPIVLVRSDRLASNCVI